MLRVWSRFQSWTGRFLPSGTRNREKYETHVDFNEKLIHILGWFFVCIKTKNKEIQKRRVLISKTGVKEKVACKWLAVVTCKLEVRQESSVMIFHTNLGETDKTNKRTKKDKQNRLTWVTRKWVKKRDEQKNRWNCWLSDAGNWTFLPQKVNWRNFSQKECRIISIKLERAVEKMQKC